MRREGISVCRLVVLLAVATVGTEGASLVWSAPQGLPADLVGGEGEAPDGARFEPWRSFTPGKLCKRRLHNSKFSPGRLEAATSSSASRPAHAHENRTSFGRSNQHPEYWRN